ncbi:hypothetical protein MHBO_001270, partial [Bonamia ostreae]
MTENKGIIEPKIIKDEKEEIRKDGKKSVQIERSEWWIISENNEKVYFYNAALKTTCWRLPEDFVKENLDAILKIRNKTGIKMPIDFKNTKPLEETAARNTETKKNKSNRQKKSQRIPKTEWWVIDDPEAPKIYFYNASENKTSWELPDEIKKIYNFTIKVKNNDIPSSPYTASNGDYNSLGDLATTNRNIHKSRYSDGMDKTNLHKEALIRANENYLSLNIH